jgi:hypothetical protein
VTKDTNSKDKDSNKNGINPITAGAIGLVTGVVGATAIAMKDEVIREQAKKKLSDAKDKVKETAENIKNEAIKTKDKVKDSANEVSDDIREAIENEDNV